MTDCRQARHLLGDETAVRWRIEVIDLTKREIKTVVEWLTGHCNIGYYKYRVLREGSGTCRWCGR